MKRSILLNDDINRVFMDKKIRKMGKTKILDQLKANLAKKIDEEG